MEEVRRRRLNELLGNHCKKALAHITSHKVRWGMGRPAGVGCLSAAASSRDLLHLFGLNSLSNASAGRLPRLVLGIAARGQPPPPLTGAPFPTRPSTHRAPS